MLRNMAIGRSINMSARSAATIAKALSHPKSRSDGRLDSRTYLYLLDGCRRDYGSFGSRCDQCIRNVLHQGYHGSRLL